ncbi:MAG: hypothetical protein GY730_05225 [bacterium]|nr:hypothetical protein [bacterium]
MFKIISNSQRCNVTFKMKKYLDQYEKDRNNLVSGIFSDTLNTIKLSGDFGEKEAICYLLSIITGKMQVNVSVSSILLKHPFKELFDHAYNLCPQLDRQSLVQDNMANVISDLLENEIHKTLEQKYEVLNASQYKILLEMLKIYDLPSFTKKQCSSDLKDLAAEALAKIDKAESLTLLRFILNKFNNYDPKDISNLYIQEAIDKIEKFSVGKSDQYRTYDSINDMLDFLCKTEIDEDVLKFFESRIECLSSVLINTLKSVQDKKQKHILVVLSGKLKLKKSLPVLVNFKSVDYVEVFLNNYLQQCCCKNSEYTGYMQCLKTLNESLKASGDEKLNPKISGNFFDKNIDFIQKKSITGKKTLFQIHFLKEILTLADYYGYKDVVNKIILLNHDNKCAEAIASHCSKNNIDAADSLLKVLEQRLSLANQSKPDVSMTINAIYKLSSSEKKDINLDILYAYYNHMNGSSKISLDRLKNKREKNKVQDELQDVLQNNNKCCVIS